MDAWKWVSNDSILHVLPLHHVHGIVNALMCPLSVGAKCIMLSKFDATTVWSYLLGVNSPSPTERKVSVFMAVPTIYTKLIEEYEKVFSADEKMVEYIKATLSNKVRLMVSGSSSLSPPLFEKWQEISGHKLLERYGMTEIGMCLSNGYDTERLPGYVGAPLNGVSVQLLSEPQPGKFEVTFECSNVNGQMTIKPNENIKEDPIGELLVKGK